MSADRVAAIIFLFIGSVFYYMSFSYPHESTIYVRFILMVFMVLSIFLFIRPNKKAGKSFKELFTPKINSALVLIIIYVLLVSILGFFVSSFIFLIAFMWFFNHRGIPKYLLAAAISLLGIYVLFVEFLTVWFPTGILM